METTRLLCMAGVLLLSLVLPLLASGRSARLVPLVWKAQLVAALGGTLVLTPLLHPAWGLGVAAAAVLYYSRRILKLAD